MATEYTFTLLDRRKTIAIHRKGEEDYCSTCEVTIHGDMAVVESLNGREFYALMSRQGREVMKALGVERLEGYVKDAHLRLMQLRLTAIATIEVTRTGVSDGRLMNWIVITPKWDVVLPDAEVSDATLDSGKGK